MPFTFSHPAIVLPFFFLRKKWFSLTGLIAGSIVPDFEYFIRMKIQSNYSHTISAILWFDLPLAILLTFIFHNIVRNKLYENLPIFFKSRLTKYSNFNWNNYFKNHWLVVITSIVIGTVSHILWDSFTHDNGYFVLRMMELKRSLNVNGYEIPIFKILQHMSSILGALFLALAFYKLKPERTSDIKYKSNFWMIFIIATFLIIFIRFLCGMEYKQYGNIIVTSISALMISLIVTSLFSRQKELKLIV